MNRLSVDIGRLAADIQALGAIGRNDSGALTRLALDDNDRLGRAFVADLARSIGLVETLDAIGNQYFLWQPDGTEGKPAVLIGSHLDTVINAGIYDGCYGVLAGLAVLRCLKDAGFQPRRPIAVAAFTNEEGVRFQPDMMGSLVAAGGMPLAEALSTLGTDGVLLGDALEAIGARGAEPPGFLAIHAYLELHVEQGPVLERTGDTIGAVAALQGISWQKVTIEGRANHAGTTPMSMRADAGVAAARVIAFLRGLAGGSRSGTVATVGSIAFEPNAINVIPSRAVFTVDLRDPDEALLQDAERALADFLAQIEGEEGVRVTTEPLARFQPVQFDEGLVCAIEVAAAERSLACRRMVSGAGHDAQMMARIAPAAMIFVPSVGGISHNPLEFTAAGDLEAGANILLDVVQSLATREG